MYASLLLTQLKIYYPVKIILGVYLFIKYNYAVLKSLTIFGLSLDFFWSAISVGINNPDYVYDFEFLVLND